MALVSLACLACPQHVSVLAAGKRGSPPPETPLVPSWRRGPRSSSLSSRGGRVSITDQGVSGEGEGGLAWPGLAWLTTPRVSRLIVADAGDHRSLIRGFPMGSQPRALTACLLALLGCRAFASLPALRCPAMRAWPHLNRPTAPTGGFKLVCVYVCTPLWDSILVLIRVMDGRGRERGPLALPHSSPSRCQWFGRPPVHPPRS
jgi:hypothetical protein